MAFGAKKIFPIDTKPGIAVGVSLPFNAPNVFYSTYTTKDSIKYNLINFFFPSACISIFPILRGALPVEIEFL